MSWIVDASVAAKWFFPEDDHQAALGILDRPETLHAPSFVLVELANIAWLKSQRGDVPQAGIPQILDFAQATFDSLHPDAGWLRRAVAMVSELNHSVYDCLYLAGAEALNATVITADRRFLQKLRGTKYENRAFFLTDLPAR